MRRSEALALACGLGVSSALLISACEEPAVVGPPPTRPAPQTTGEARAEGDASEPAEAAPEYKDEVFTELDVENRDPFRSFVSVFKLQVPKVVQRRVLMPNTDIDHMRLIAIVTGVSQPRAMVVDPLGVGHVVKRGDYVGRAEVIQAGGAEGMPITLNWRVGRIRSSEVVLSREDPTSSNAAPLTRVLPLYTESELLAMPEALRD